MKYYIIFGPPGAGKGTQSQLLVEKYNLIHISTGELLREKIAMGDSLGKELEGIINRGEFVEDSIVLQIICDKVDSAPEGTKGFIFDGFPRTISQAEAFDKMMAENGRGPITALLSLEIEDEPLVDRLHKRAEIEHRKDDASIETIRQRISTYHKKTKPLIEFYRNQEKYWPVEGDKGIEEVFKSLCKVVDKF